MKLNKVKKLIESTIKKLNEQTPSQCNTLAANQAWGGCCEDALAGQNSPNTWQNRPSCKAIYMQAAQMGLSLQQMESCCPGGITTINTCPTCNTSHWSNYTTWATYWTNLTNQNPFFLPGANQPCDFICDKIDYWETKCPTVGPNWQNQLACKIDVGYSQDAVHGCNC